MKVLGIISIGFMAILYALAIAAWVYFGIIEPIHRAVKNLIESRRSLNKDARAGEVRDM